MIDEGQSDGSGDDDVSPTICTGRGDNAPRQFSDQRAPLERSGQPPPDWEFGSSTLWSNSSRLVRFSILCFKKLRTCSRMISLDFAEMYGHKRTLMKRMTLDQIHLPECNKNPCIKSRYHLQLNLYYDRLDLVRSSLSTFNDARVNIQI